MLFTADTMSHLSLSTRLVMFILFENGLLALKMATDLLVDDVPRPVRVHIERQDYLRSKIINREPDDVDDFDVSTTRIDWSVYEEMEVEG